MYCFNVNQIHKFIVHNTIASSPGPNFSIRRASVVANILREKFGAGDEANNTSAHASSLTLSLDQESTAHDSMMAALLASPAHLLLLIMWPLLQLQACRPSHCSNSFHQLPALKYNINDHNCCTHFTNQRYNGKRSPKILDYHSVLRHKINVLQPLPGGVSMGLAVSGVKACFITLQRHQYWHTLVIWETTNRCK